jgi:large subunit ribosomal protein L23
MFRPDFREKPSRERKSMAEQAKALLQGKEGWRSTPKGNEWSEDGEEIEVETGVELPRVGP